MRLETNCFQHHNNPSGPSHAYGCKRTHLQFPWPLNQSSIVFMYIVEISISISSSTYFRNCANSSEMTYIYELKALNYQFCNQLSGVSIKSI
ncbi:hypothetical protein F0562_033565 [Nyssa sinensis]|uniref:Uncharacterized protein n=1 Tax=Nyssa sinensis TaxID=561372 RepID=A0A5J5AHL9_9ASTE|nr:hypothetical protein F0562_033565 [Nyssa sinensis]